MATNSLAPVHEQTINLVDPARHRIFPDPAASTTDFLQTSAVISLVSEKSFVARLTIVNGVGNAVNIALANMPTIEMTIAAIDDPTTSPTVLASRSITDSIIEVDAANGIVDFVCPPQALLRYYATEFTDQNNGSCRIAFRMVNTAGEDIQFHDNVNIEDNEFSNQGGTPPVGFSVVVTNPSATQVIEADSPSAIPLKVLGDIAQSVNLFEVKEVDDINGIEVLATGELTATVDPTTGDGVGNRDYNDGRYEVSGNPNGYTVGPVVAVDGNLAAYDGITGELILDSGIAASDVTANTAKNDFDTASSTKVDFISITQAVDLDTMETGVANADSHAANNANPHSVTALQVGSATAQFNADKIQDVVVVDLSGISNGEVLAFNGSSGEFEPVANGGAGTSGRPAFECNFDTDITASEPATGAIKFNNAVPGSATTIRVSTTDINTIPITNQLSSVGSGDAFIVYQLDSPTKFLYFSVASSTLVTTSYDIVGSSIGGGVAIDNGAPCGIAAYILTVGGASGVASFNGRVGGVVPASGDYDGSQVANTSGVSGSTIDDALNTLNNSISPEAVAGGVDNNQTGVAYELVLTDKDNTNIYMNNALLNTLTIPLDVTVAFPIGLTKIPVMMEGVGITTIDGAVGVTINGVLNGSVVINNRFQGALLQKRGTDTWIVSGDIT